MKNIANKYSFVLSLVDLFVEAECRKILIDLVRGPHCKICKSPVPARHLKRFYEGKQVSCKICKSKFIPIAGTILSQSKITNKQILKMLVMIDAGFRTKEIAAIIGISKATVPRWRRKLIKWINENER
jgi:transposase-like protein